MNTEKTSKFPTCGCLNTPAPTRAPDKAATDSSKPVKLGNLMPIAVVITAGCEPCAQRTIVRAQSEGSSARDVRKVVAHLQQLQGLNRKIGQKVIDRMDKPMVIAMRMLKEAVVNWQLRAG